MPFRDAVLALVIFGSLPVCFARPWVGVLVWTWLGFMSPHRLGWGFAQNFGFSELVAVATLGGLILTSDRRPVPRGLTPVLLFAFWGITGFSTMFARYQNLAWADLNQLSKILLMCVVTMMLIHDRAKLRWFLLVMSLSIGFYGVKAGLWALLPGSEHGRALGPEGSFIGDNNGLALGLSMTVPLLFFLAQEERRRWLRLGLYVTCALSALTIVFTYSRGGFLGLAAVCLMMLVRARKWTAAAAVVVVGAAVLMWLAPQQWSGRIGTIATYEADMSAMSRLWAWGIGWQLALESPLLGWGFRIYSPEIWARFMPGYHTWHNAHSVYFQVLAEHGFTGLFLFLGLLMSALGDLRAARREARGSDERAWVIPYAGGIEAGIVAFMVAGTFYNLAYADLIYVLIALSSILRQTAGDRVTRALTPTVPARGRAGALVAGDCRPNGRPPATVVSGTARTRMDKPIRMGRTSSPGPAAEGL
jgi:putative inorganic carbon (HCO3(-)) transporter